VSSARSPQVTKSGWSTSRSDLALGVRRTHSTRQKRTSSAGAAYRNIRFGLPAVTCTAAQQMTRELQLIANRSANGNFASYTSCMAQFTYAGSAANLRMLAEELHQDEEIAAGCTIEVLEQEPSRDSLHNAELAQIVISVASGVATNFITDAIRAAVDRARDRGSVTPVQPNIEDAKKGEAVDTRSLGDPS
jgi:hypothetical protein